MGGRLGILASNSGFETCGIERENVSARNAVGAQRFTGVHDCGADRVAAGQSRMAMAEVRLRVQERRDRDHSGLNRRAIRTQPLEKDSSCVFLSERHRSDVHLWPEEF
jgi:hypothetical protein